MLFQLFRYTHFFFIYISPWYTAQTAHVHAAKSRARQHGHVLFVHHHDTMEKLMKHMKPLTDKEDDISVLGSLIDGVNVREVGR